MFHSEALEKGFNLADQSMFISLQDTVTWSILIFNISFGILHISSIMLGITWYMSDGNIKEIAYNNSYKITAENF